MYYLLRRYLLATGWIVVGDVVNNCISQYRTDFSVYPVDGLELLLINQRFEYRQYIGGFDLIDCLVPQSRKGETILCRICVTNRGPKTLARKQCRCLPKITVTRRNCGESPINPPM